MKRLLFGVSAAFLVTAMTGPALACMGEHGYKKTAQSLQQSTLSAQKKAALMQVIQQSKADHDKFTASGEYGKMNEAVGKLGDVNRQIGQ
ncbi:MAG: hypothetical protein OXR84_06940 [Magnetovibrio sp.]|nr:hypothetical protein [Magnetovibrio sp.]